jgi:hypothetical protein
MTGFGFGGGVLHHQIYESITSGAGTNGPSVFNLKGAMMNVIAPFRLTSSHA